MTECTQGKINFLPFNGKKVEAEFCDKEITSDAGLLLVREVDNKIGLIESVATLIPDLRSQSHITHSMKSMLQQRIYGLCLGYEDLNDHEQLRHDPALQVVTENNKALASSSTLCRLENTITLKTGAELHKPIVDIFIKSHKKAPREIIIDADPTDDETHGNQEKKYYHGYYKHNCFLPVNFFCGNHLLVSYLRPSNIDPAKHVGGILSLLVKYIRKHWPKTRIIFRADGGLCRDNILRWCERNKIHYIVGYSRNSRLEKASKDLVARAALDYEKTGEKQTLYDQIYYSAYSWTGGMRKVIFKAEYSEKGKNIRFILTTLNKLPENCYKFYCGRGDAENRIKELKLECYSGRTSCHDWSANQFRLLLSSFAYVLLNAVREIALVKTSLKNASCKTIRIKLLKIGAIVTRSRRRVHIAMSKHFVKKIDFTIATKVASSYG